jgi:hypothetical protein
MNLKRGDVLLFQGKDLISYLIRHITRSDYSHAGIYYGMIEHRHFIVEAMAWGVSLNALDVKAPHSFDVYRVNNHCLTYEELGTRIIEGVNIKYDYSALCGIYLEERKILNKNILNDVSKLICSEYVSMVYSPLFGDCSIISPADIANSEHTSLIIKNIVNSKSINEGTE